MKNLPSQNIGLLYETLHIVIKINIVNINIVLMI